MMRLTIFVLSMVLFGQLETVAQESNKEEHEQLSESVLITIRGMACQEGCADTIAKNLKAVPGVKAAEVSFENEKAKVDFNPDEVSVATLKSVILNTKVKDYAYTVAEMVPITND